MKISELTESLEIEVKSSLLNNVQTLDTISKVTSLIVETFENGGKLFFCGNGGSAADAQHISAEFTGRFNKDRAPLNAEALHVNTSYLTAVANDYGYDQVYLRLLKAKAKKGDVLFGLSTSGNSRNVVEAMKFASGNDIHTVGMVGNDAGHLGSCSDFLIKIESSKVARIQECHILIGHIFCSNVERIIFP